MELKARLIYKSFMTYFNKFLPVYFYGMPNGKIYCIYARFCENKSCHSGLEFVFALYEDFMYDYESDKIIAFGFKETSLQSFIDTVNSPDQSIRIIKVYGNLASYVEAHAILNLKAGNMMHTQELEQSSFLPGIF